MSTDEKVSKDLIETLEDGKNGFAQAAEQLAGSDRSDLAQRMQEISQQRASFSAELRSMAAAYGDDIDEQGSVAAAMHRGWMSMKDALTGSDPEAILNAAETGEGHAVTEFSKALDEDISDGLRSTVQTQFTQIKQSHEEIKRLAASVS